MKKEKKKKKYSRSLKFQDDDCLLGKKLLLNYFPIPTFFLIRKNDRFFLMACLFPSPLFFKKPASIKLVHTKVDLFVKA